MPGLPPREISDRRVIPRWSRRISAKGASLRGSDHAFGSLPAPGASSMTRSTSDGDCSRRGVDTMPHPDSYSLPAAIGSCSAHVERLSAGQVRCSLLTRGTLLSLIVAVAMFVGAVETSSEKAVNAPEGQIWTSPEGGIGCVTRFSSRRMGSCWHRWTRTATRLCGTPRPVSRAVRNLVARSKSGHWPSHRTVGSWLRGTTARQSASGTSRHQRS